MKGNTYQIGFVYLLVVLLVLVGCQNELQEAASVASDAEEAVVAEEANVVPNDPGLISSAGDMAGIWLGTLAGERGYLMYTEDGRYTLALSEDTVGSAPRVSGEYWFEDGKIHLRDLENAGHWTVCDAETVGVYEVMVADDSSVHFQTVEDDCDEGGFTRNYVFANITQERIAEPVAIE